MDAVGDEKNSPYTALFSEELADARVSMQAALARANRKGHSLRTSMSQRPYMSSDLNGDIYLRQMPESR